MLLQDGPLLYLRFAGLFRYYHHVAQLSDLSIRQRIHAGGEPCLSPVDDILVNAYRSAAETILTQIID